MNIQKSAIASALSLAMTAAIGSVAHAQEITTGINDLVEVGSPSAAPSAVGTGVYIVQLRGDSAVDYQLVGDTLPQSSQLVLGDNRYNSNDSATRAYTERLKARQDAMASDLGGITILHNYVHTFNGFAAQLSDAQVKALKSDPNVAAVYENEILTLDTANTPEFLGLVNEVGARTVAETGEGVIIGVVDSGIWPENPSFADDGSYAPLSEEEWAGACDAGSEAAENTFVCNNKLIGARFFGDGFASVYDIQFELGETLSPRDADGHGTHTASTAGGNAGVTAVVQGVEVGEVSGIAPRARVAAYKACWNADYVSPEGVNERGCFSVDTMAAIDAAVADGVDIINYSISGSRDDLTTAPTAAMLRAARAGVLVSVSAGNSGPGPGTVGTPAPWVMSVGASTYDGVSAVVSDAITVTSGDLEATDYLAVPAAFGPRYGEGFVGTVVAVDNVNGCAAPGNTEEIAGNLALIQRGGCGFVDKVQNAEAAGATGVVVYNNVAGAPITMGGTPTAEITIPSLMISLDDGTELAAAAGENATTVAALGRKVVEEQNEVGNLMAGFSSRGVNLSTGDIIKPDVTAPGVRILAGTSSRQLNGTVGETYAYLSGTSMSSPHMAGMAALVVEAFQSRGVAYTPAMVKSALMTTARQNVLKEDALTAADPFDFGAGHADPLSALTPALTYDTSFFDYMGAMCSLDEGFVLREAGFPCSAFAANNFTADFSQLNYPSIAVDGLRDPEFVVRRLTDISGVADSYTVSVDMPAGVDVSVVTFDGNGSVTPQSTLDVDANGSAFYGVEVSKNENAVIDQWTFGSITFTGTNGNVVRSPIAVQPAAPIKIEVPTRLDVELRRGRGTVPIKMNYSGSTSMDYAGFAAPFGSSRTVTADPDGTFEFLDPSLGRSDFIVPEGTKLAKFALDPRLIAVEGADLDLYVYLCEQNPDTGRFSCGQVATSTNIGSSVESVELVNPRPANGVTGFYLVWVHPRDIGDAPTSDYTMLGWVLDGADSSTRMRASTRAVEGRFNNVRISTRGLAPSAFPYMGAATFYDDEGLAQGTTILEVNP